MGRRQMHRLFWLEDQNALLGRPRHSWENNTRIDLRETEWYVIDWVNLAPDRRSMVYPSEHGNESLGFVNLEKCVSR
jgi:hypothetical protein